MIYHDRGNVWPSANLKNPMQKKLDEWGLGHWDDDVE